MEHVFINKTKQMERDFNDKAFSPFILTISNFLLKSCEYKNYFRQTKDKNLEAQLGLFKLLKSNVKLNTQITDNEMKRLIDKLAEKSDETENYEFSQLLVDLKTNYSKMREYEITIKKNKQEKKALT